MSKLTYVAARRFDKRLVWLGRGVNTPPFSAAGRVAAGYRLRLLQRGERLGMPHSRPMPVIGPSCYELRVRDEDHFWRLVYRIDDDAIVIVEVFDKQSRQTPRQIVELCRKRLRAYDESAAEGPEQ
jgi:phage-related protein